MRVSHETIYKSLFIQSRGVLTKQLQTHLPSGRPVRRSVHNTVTGHSGDHRSKMPYQSHNCPPKLKTERSPDTGKATDSQSESHEKEE